MVSTAVLEQFSDRADERYDAALTNNYSLLTVRFALVLFLAPCHSVESSERDASS